MIEVGKKIALNESDLKNIERLGTFLGTQTMTDTYLDTSDFRYTTNDIWLRERDCQYELKIGVQGIDGNVNRYEEITDKEKILEKLGLKQEKSFLSVLSEAKIFPYASFQTIRRKYQIEEFTLDLDLAYFDDFIYRIAKIELLVNNETRINQAEKSIEAFIEKLGLGQKKPARAKLVEYLSQKNPTHYQALIASGVVK